MEVLRVSEREAVILNDLMWRTMWRTYLNKHFDRHIFTIKRRFDNMEDAAMCTKWATDAMRNKTKKKIRINGEYHWEEEM